MYRPGTTAVANSDFRTVRLAVVLAEKFGMKKYINFCFSVLVVLLTLASASAFADESTLVGTPVEKEWTMMVYLNGNNSLDEFGAVNINQMEQIGSDARLNIIVQWASMAASSTKRLYIKKDNDTKRVTSPVIENLAEVDMGKKQSLTDFISWTAKRYPAKHYFVVVWNHGGGWHFVNPNRAAGDLHVTDISWDEKSGHHITTEELGEAMKDAAKIFGHKVDIYGSDACLMAMAEVAYEMNGSVETFVGSEEVEPGTGWPYSKFLADWSKNPKASTLEIGKMLATRYGELYNSDSDQATFSVFDMSKLPAFVASMKNLGTSLRAMPDQAGLLAQTRLAVRFTDDDYVDVGNVIGRVKTVATDAATLKSIASVQAQIKSLVYFNSANTKATGVSIWWPTESSVWESYQVRYSNLAFNRKSNWYVFLKTFF